MIIFKTKHHADVVMFDNIALSLIGIMGHSKTVPGALTEEEIAPAIQSLKAATDNAQAKSGDSWDDDSVSLSHRASPLLELLDAANKNNEHVIWENSLL